MKFKPSMKKEYCDAESFHISISPSDGLQFLNGTVHPLSPTIAFVEFEGIEDTSFMAVKHIDYFCNFWDMSSLSSLSPHQVENEHLGMFTFGLDNVTELFLDTPSVGNLQVGLDNGIEAYLFLGRKILLILEEKKPASLENVISLHLTSSDTINSILQMPYQMIWIMTDANLWHKLQCSILEVVPHVDGERQDICLLYGIQGFVYQPLCIFSLSSSDNFKDSPVICIEDTNIVVSTTGLLIYVYMTIHYGVAATGESILHSPFHHMMSLVFRKTKQSGCCYLFLSLEESDYRFFSNMEVTCSPESAQGTSRLTTLPSTRYRGMRAIMKVRYCHRSRWRHTRSLRKSKIGNLLPATLTSDLQKRTYTCMHSLESSFLYDSTCQSPPTGSRRDESISCMSSVILQRYAHFLTYWHIYMLICLTTRIVNSH